MHLPQLPILSIVCSFAFVSFIIGTNVLEDFQSYTQPFAPWRIPPLSSLIVSISKPVIVQDGCLWYDEAWCYSLYLSITITEMAKRLKKNDATDNTQVGVHTTVSADEIGRAHV